MKILITAGSTTVLIDKVRSITNIFKGKTGALLANYFSKQGDEVTLITSSPEKVDQYVEQDIRVLPYKTFNDLKEIMKDA